MQQIPRTNPDREARLAMPDTEVPVTAATVVTVTGIKCAAGAITADATTTDKES